MKTQTLMRIIMCVVAIFSVITLVIAYDFTQNVKESQILRQKDVTLKSMCKGEVSMEPSIPNEFCKCLAKGESDIVCKMFLV